MLNGWRRKEVEIEAGTWIASPPLHTQSGVAADRGRHQQYPSATEYRRSSLVETRLETPNAGHRCQTTGVVPTSRASSST
ncbi:hypothetical protein EOD39_10277 [Acipenser ruthenus]|uniref:Uncharacterized protein n=1 Tax=Acipenser ruthenus TaxID=7906 RepID=A0A444TY33_ACIRT|nr:hypothetical protein EOD39_10277 [Acipenser ruthenus]